MARAQTIRRTTTRKNTKRRSRKKKNPGLRFLPDFLQAFLARRFVDIVAGVLFVSGFITLVALVSYDHSDPSWNTAASAENAQNIANWAGMPGAWIADLLLQTLGGGGFVIGIVFSVWGVRIFRRQNLYPVWTRPVSLMVAAIFSAVALSMVPAGEWMVHPYMGSSAGTIILDTIVVLGQSFGGGYGPGIFALASAVLACFALFHACAVTRDELFFFFGTIKRLALAAVLLVLAAARHFYGWLRHYNDPQYAMPEIKLFKNFRAKNTRKEPVISPPVIAQPQAYQLPPQPQPAPQDQKAPGIPVVTPQKAAQPPPPPVDTQQRFALSDIGEWELPPLSLLQEAPPEVQEATLSDEALRKNAELLQNVLSDFNIQGDIVSIHPGPVVTLYELEPAPGTKTSRVISLSDDIARSMSAVSVRCAVVPGRNVIGIELPNKTRHIVYMQELLASRMVEKTKAKLPLILGKDIAGQPILADLVKMPHLLVAGTTGSGKSVAINTMLMSLLFRMPPEKCRLIMIDPKMLELSVYDGIPHLLSPVVTEPSKAIVALKWAVQEMEGAKFSLSGKIADTQNLSGIDMKFSGQARDVKVLAASFSADTKSWPAGLKKAEILAALKGSAQKLAVTANIKALNGELIAEGDVLTPLTSAKIENLSLQVKHGNLAGLIKTFNPAFKSSRPLEKPVNIFAAVNQDGKTYKFSNIKGTLAGTAMQGSAAIDMNGAKPSIIGQLQFGDLVLGAPAKKTLRTSPSSGGSKKRAAGAKGGGDVRWSREAINTAWMHAADADLDIAAKSITYGKWRLKNPALKTKLSGGQLNISKLDAGLFGGQMTMSAKIKSSENPRQPITIESSSQLRNVSVEALVLALAGDKIVKGKGLISMDTQMSSVGLSPAALIYDMQGKGSLSGQDLVLEGYDLTHFAAAMSDDTKLVRNVEQIWQGASAGGSTSFDTLEGNFTMNEGVINVSRLALESKTTSVVAKGNINLPRWWIDMPVTIAMKPPYDIPPYTIPIEGPLDNPSAVRDNILGDFVMRKLERKAGKELNKLLGKMLDVPQQQPASEPEQVAPDGGAEEGQAPQPAAPQQPQEIKPEDLIRGVLGGLLR